MYAHTELWENSITPKRTRTPDFRSVQFEGIVCSTILADDPSIISTIAKAVDDTLS